MCKYVCAEPCGDRTLVGCRCAGSSGIVSGITWDGEGIVSTPSRIVRGPEGDRAHLQRWVCGCVRGSYPCRMSLCGIIRGLRVHRKPTFSGSCWITETGNGKNHHMTGHSNRHCYCQPHRAKKVPTLLLGLTWAGRAIMFGPFSFVTFFPSMLSPATHPFR